jgi:signal transduction histidine kinase
MHLSEFLSVSNEQIVCAWEDFAKTLSGDVALPRWLLRDHAPAILRFITQQMPGYTVPVPQNLNVASRNPADPVEQLAAAHVKVRIDSGFDLAQIISEYCALRACVLRLWQEQAPNDFNSGGAEISRFDELVDEHITAAVVSYKERESQYRDRFLGILGHDLRNPINAISSGATHLATQGLNERQLKTLARIQNSTRRLSAMVNDIVDFARGRLGSPMPIVTALVNLSVVVSEIVNEVQLANPGCAIDFEAEPAVDGEWDTERLKQLIANLLINAVQHGTGERVKVTVTSDGSSAVIEVHNRSPVIPPDLLATIFEPMVRGSANQDGSGLGLGLFIAREIVSAHHGTIAVNSAEDTGTTFVVRLPRHSS